MKNLKLVLQVNAISSGLTGIGLVVFNHFCSNLFEVSADGIFIAVGLFLVAFAAFVYSESLPTPLRASRVRIISALDVSWVIGSAILILVFWNSISLIGNILIIMVALWVAAMAVLQNYFNHQKITKAVA